jgi:hypothetical protein
MAPLLTDPVCLLLTEDGDLDRSAHRLQFARGVDAVVQGVRTRMLLVRGEWFLDRDVGVPYLESDLVAPADAILGQRYDEAKIVAAFRRPILATPGVRGILLLRPTFTAATRSLGIEWRARTVFGDTPVDQLQVEA